MPATESLLERNELDAEETCQSNHVHAQGNTSHVHGDWRAVSENMKSDMPVALSTVPVQQDWHEIPEISLTPELRRDLILLENRQHLDPKRFYKSSGTGRKNGQLPTRVHLGVVVEAPHEYLSARLTNKERKKSFADEILSDPHIMANARRRFQDIQSSRADRKRIVDPAARKIRRKKRGR